MAAELNTAKQELLTFRSQALLPPIEQQTFIGDIRISRSDATEFGIDPDELTQFEQLFDGDSEVIELLPHPALVEYDKHLLGRDWTKTTVRNINDQILTFIRWTDSNGIPASSSNSREVPLALKPFFYSEGRRPPRITNESIPIFLGLDNMQQVISHFDNNL